MHYAYNNENILRPSAIDNIYKSPIALYWFVGMRPWIPNRKTIGRTEDGNNPNILISVQVYLQTLNTQYGWSRTNESLESPMEALAMEPVISRTLCRL